jgi:chromate transporter
VKSVPSPGALARTFFRLVNTTFGGGDPAMAALYRELVSRRGWLGQAQYGLAYGLARLTPGTNLLAFCAGSAWLIRGWRGALLAVAAATIPSSCALVLLTWSYERVHHHPLAGAVVGALLAAAVGMMMAAAALLLRPSLTRARALRTLVLFGAAAALLLLGWMGPLQVLALAAVAGLLWTGRG